MMMTKRIAMMVICSPKFMGDGAALAGFELGPGHYDGDEVFIIKITIAIIIIIIIIITSIIVIIIIIIVIIIIKMARRRLSKLQLPCHQPDHRLSRQLVQ